MGLRCLGFVLAAASAAALAAPRAAQALPLPFRSSECKEQKTRLHHEERILQDRQQLALDQCRASSAGSSSRCDDLKRQQKAQRGELKERQKLALRQCKENVKAGKAGTPAGDAREPKRASKKDAPDKKGKK